MQERIVISEKIRQAQSDINLGTHGEVDASQTLFTGSEPNVEIYVISEQKAGIYMSNQHSLTQRGEFVLKGGE